MFTGIVTDRGRVEALTAADGVVRLEILAPATTATLDVGDSVAVNGACLTAVDVSSDRFAVEAIPETMMRTTLGTLDVGDLVNLERPLKADGRLDGHIVQGHVDAVAEVTAVTPDEGSVRLRFTLPDDLSRFVVEKGSITVDGVSLTVTALSGRDVSAGWFEVAVIPHTLDVTSLGKVDVGSYVNLEIDPIAKYVERMIGGRG